MPDTCKTKEMDMRDKCEVCEDRKQTYDSDNAVDDRRALWLCIAQEIDEHTRGILSDAKFEQAIEQAKLAEACYWHATGEGDCFDLETHKVMPRSPTIAKETDNAQ